MNEFTVLTVDIKESKKLSQEDMTKVNNEINDIFKEINNTLSTSLYTSGFTTGDEFEIVLHRPTQIIQLIYLIQAKLTTEYRIGIGIGEITDPNGSKDPNQMWGTAFTRARDALNYSKNNDTEAHIITPNKETNQQINSTFNLINHIRQNMTANQRNIIDQYNYSLATKQVTSQRQLANKLGKSDAMISKTLKKTGHQHIKNAETQIQQTLNDPNKINPDPKTENPIKSSVHR